jgi:hypothetical protein
MGFTMKKTSILELNQFRIGSILVLKGTIRCCRGLHLQMKKRLGCEFKTANVGQRATS